jgi:hypothetical protein
LVLGTYITGGAAFDPRRGSISSPSGHQLRLQAAHGIQLERSFGPADVVISGAHGRALRMARKPRTRIGRNEPEVAVPGRRLPPAGGGDVMGAAGSESPFWPGRSKLPGSRSRRVPTADRSGRGVGLPKVFWLGAARRGYRLAFATVHEWVNRLSAAK